MSVIDWAAQARRRCRLPKIFSARSYLRGNWVAEDIMAMKMPKNRRVVKEICRRLGNHRGIRQQILQSLKKCDIYEKMISEKSIKEPVEYQKEQKFVEDKMYGGMVL